ncbi:MAG: ice-binding family protein [Candidatus Gracilibacteria bacterium]|jgi:hypothetical protein
MEKFNKVTTMVTMLVISCALIGLPGPIALAATTVDLGTADGFAVLAKSAITDNNISVISGNVGLNAAGTQYLTPVLTTGEVAGTIYANDATGPAGGAGSNNGLMVSAQSDLATAYGNAAAQAPATTTYPPIHDLGGETLVPGIYNDPSSFAITGTLTLDGGNNPNAVFIFQAGSTLTTAAGSVVRLVNGAQACNVFWQVGSSATFGVGSTFKGNVLAMASITDAGSSNIAGRLLARTGAVTLNGTTINAAVCQTSHLIVIKHVVNDDAGIKGAGDFSTTISGVTTATPTAVGAEDPGVDNLLTSIGAYSIDEGADVGYTKTLSADCSGTIGVGDTKICTITNNDIAVVPPVTATLHIIKHVVNDNTGVTLAPAFTINVTGTNVSDASFSGAEDPGTTITLDAGAYTVDETAAAGYNKFLGTDCSGTITAGGTKYCTITNNDIAPPAPDQGILHITKHVINDNTGVTLAPAFTINVTGTNVSDASFSGAEDPGTTITLDAGAYTVDETAVAGYVKSLGADCSGTIVAGQTKYCTITNDDILVPPLASTITVVKTVTNDSGRNKTTDDFNLFVDALPVTRGVANSFSAGAHVVTETADPDYTQTFAVDCTDGIVNLIPGDDKICIINNNDKAIPSSGGGGGGGGSYTPPVPPIIDVVKVPSPLALPGGPGPVKYTYTLRNIGTVPVTNVTMVGDTCSPITLTSGDTDADTKLDLNETWVYNCTKTISVTHTNTVVATGWANGISATDIASATVVVGAPIVPPLIHVTKVPSPLVLLAGRGMVTYTKKITNPGTVALSNVIITDDKCSPVRYITGDTNKDSKLDPAETWTYTCKANLTKTTMNTAIATGEANGLTARDFAIVTVVVADTVSASVIPTLPNTGLPPEDEGSPWNIIMLFGGIILGTTLLVVVLRKRTT